MKNILILRGGAVGDFILTIPVFHLLRETWPEARIELVGYPRIAGLVLESGLVNAFHSLDDAEAAKLFAGGREAGYSKYPSGGWLESVGNHDVVISYLHDPDGIVQKNLVAAGARRVICHPPLPTAGHAIDHLLAPLKELGIDIPRDMAPSLDVSDFGIRPGFLEDDPSLAGQYEDLPFKRVAIHPGSGSLKKNWPVEKYLELARLIGEATDYKPFIILGEADEDAAGLMKEKAPFLPVVENVDLSELAAILEESDIYVGNDSGITHLAAAVGIPVVALFGPSDPDMWGPRGDNVMILCAQERTTESLARIAVKAVARSIAAAG